MRVRFPWALNRWYFAVPCNGVMGRQLCFLHNIVVKIAGQMQDVRLEMDMNVYECIQEEDEVSAVRRKAFFDTLDKCEVREEGPNADLDRGKPKSGQRQARSGRGCERPGAVDDDHYEKIRDRFSLLRRCKKSEGTS